MFAASLLFLAAAVQFATPTPLTLLYGLHGCLSIGEKESVVAGERLIVLAAGRPQTEVRVETVGKPSDVPDCVKAFRAEQPSRIARLRLPKDLQDEVVFALRPGFLVVGGPPSRLSAVDAQRWVRTISPSLPARWRSPNLLVHAYQYGTSGGRKAAAELYLGLATLNPAGASTPIRSDQSSSAERSSSKARCWRVRKSNTNPAARSASIRKRRS